MRQIICQTILFLTIALLVNGCVGTSAETRYYALNSSAISENTNEGLIISVGPFEIPEYLNRHNVIVRGQGTNLKVLKFDYWAEPLTDAITRRIVITLSGNINEALLFNSLLLLISRPTIVCVAALRILKQMKMAKCA